MATYVTSDASLKSIADAIREKGGTTANLQYPEGFVDAIKAIEAGGGMDWDDMADAYCGARTGNVVKVVFTEGGDIHPYTFFRRNVLSVSGPKTSVGQGAFYQNASLESVSLPECTVVGKGTMVASATTGAFARCNYIKTLYMPKLTEIMGYSFANALFSAELDFPELTTIGQSAFSGCIGIKEAVFPKASNVQPSAFESCTALVKLHLPALELIPNYLARNCSNLSDVDFSAAERIQSSAFQNCSALKELALPALTSFNYSGIFQGSGIEKLDLGSCAYWMQKVFGSSAASIKHIILRTSEVCQLSNAAYIYGGTSDTVEGIYVPSDLVDSYKTATNWSTHADKIFAIEDYPEICGE